MGTRKSLEAMSAELWRTGVNPPAPPSHLERAGRHLWRSIAASKPADFWTPAMRQLLLRFVRTSVYAERIADKLDELPLGSDEAWRLGKQIAALNTNLGSLAVKMRLSASTTISPQSEGRLAERGLPLGNGSRLLGGHARWDQ